MGKGGLGIGLDALFDDNLTDVQVKKTLRLSEIEPNRAQPRKTFNDEGITALAESLKEHGMIQPILVRPIGNDMYQIVAGERRWRAAHKAELNEVPVIIREFTDIEAMQIALIENLQRENLNPIEEAVGFKELIDKFSMKQEELGKIMGRSRSSVTNTLRMLNLPEEVQELLKEGQISIGHAKVLCGLQDKEIQKKLAEKSAEGFYTVRELTKIVSKLNEKDKITPEDKLRTDSYYKEVELSLNERLGRKVKVDYGKKKGTIVLEFYDKDDLNGLLKNFIVDD